MKGYLVNIENNEFETYLLYTHEAPVYDKNAKRWFGFGEPIVVDKNHISKYVFIKEYLKNFIFLILCSVLITIICSNIYFEGIFELVLKVIITTVVFILFVVLFYRKKSEFVYTKNLLINGYKKVIKR